MTGRGDAAEALIDAADMIMFTGSTETGKRVMARAAMTLTPVSLELGGKDPMIVLADADLEHAAGYAIQYGMCNAGQTCLGIERVYAEAEIYEELTELLRDKAMQLRVGPPGDHGTIDVGSLTTDEQAEIVERHLRDAVAKGARVIAGGRRNGRFFEPTVLVDVDHTMQCMRDETFGPTLAVMRVSGAEEAVRLANDSPYGLAACVFGRDRKRAEQVARRLHAGSVSVNDALTHYGIQELPMGGWKQSGIGSRHGADGISKYCRRQSVTVSTSAVVPNVHFFPNTPSASRILQYTVKLLYGRGRES
jgi:acyl-CoA reductase-like NAD-dependent aldehyde dehydrogenase